VNDDDDGVCVEGKNEYLSDREEWSVVCLCGGNLNNNGNMGM